MGKMTGYVLAAEDAAAADWQTFPGFPGRFMPGEPLSCHQLGLDEEEADALVESLGLPLAKVAMSAKAALAEADRGPDFVPSEAAPLAAEEESPVEAEEESPVEEPGGES